MLTNPQETVDLVTFTEEILKGKLHFLCSGYILMIPMNQMLLNKLSKERNVSGHK